MENAGGAWTTTYTLYDGDNPLLQEVYTAAGRIQTNFNVIVGGKILAQYKMVYPSTESVLYFYVDNLSSRRVVVDATGNAIDRIRYSAWGVATQDVGTDNLRSFTGKDYDATGLIYFNARYYDPIVGRFLTEDPSRNGGNWYGYCGDNPVNRIDLTGMAQILADDISGNAVVVFPGEDVKKDTSVVITRNVAPEAYQSSNPPAFYQDKLSVNVRGKAIAIMPGQASASAKGPKAYNTTVENLKEGTYKGTLEATVRSGNFENIIRIDGRDILVHPDEFNAKTRANEWHTPCSAGCTVTRIGDFKVLVSTLQGLGFSYRSPTDSNLDSITLTYRKNY